MHGGYIDCQVKVLYEYHDDWFLNHTSGLPPDTDPVRDHGASSIVVAVASSLHKLVLYPCTEMVLAASCLVASANLLPFINVLFTSLVGLMA